ncbi:MAG TPA: glycosyltransferase family 39 protein [Burkholderiales bacterium]|nr:glycosyltransferase family 39 protein [Burkholderiales bacterium]
MSDTSKYTALLLLLIVQCFFWKLDTKPIYKIQELRVAETAREMVANKDWVIPYFNGELRLRKPPLAYWVAATSYTLFGKVNEFTARFGSVLFASATVFALFAWLRNLQGARTALIVCLCFISTYLGLRYSRAAESDSILVLFVTLACIQVYRLLYEEAGRKQALLLYAFMGLGFLAKGPAAVAIPLLLWLLLAMQEKRYLSLRALRDVPGILIFCTLAFAWYALVYFKVPDLPAAWAAEIDATYLGGKHQQPFYYYAVNLWKYFAPWSLFLIPAAIWFYKRRPHPPLVVFGWTWFVLSFVILSINPAKQIQYALLLSPSVALIVGHYLGNATGGFTKVNYAIYGLLALGILGLAVFMLTRLGDSLSNEAIATFFAMALLPLIVAVFLRFKDELPYLELLLACLMASATMYNQTRIYSNDSERFEVESKLFALASREYEPLYAYGLKDYGYAPALSFYAQRVIPVLGNEDALTALTKDLSAPIYVATGDTPPVWPPHIQVNPVLQEGDFALWQLTPR